MTPEAFAKKWKDWTGKESAAYQEHFNDLCALVGHETPAMADPSGTRFVFQKGVTKSTGRLGFADVWYQGRFGIEYKSPGDDLDAAYQQLLQYRENLQNPPLLVVTDFKQIIIRTNFTSSVTRKYTITLDQIASGDRLDGAGFTAAALLRAMFYDPESLNPNESREALTQSAASLFAGLADALRAYREGKFDPARGEVPLAYTDLQVAKFLTRMIFCMFASDVGLLPQGIITRLIDNFRATAPALQAQFSALFRTMSVGGPFGTDNIRHFNGGLFSDDEALSISSEYVDALRNADALDWGDIEPSIFGTLFERILDPKRRKQIGAHYTSREDIELIVRPVLLEPLEREWAEVRERVETMARDGDDARAHDTLQGFIDRLGKLRVLDPACGSGNFLYVSLALLKGLEQSVVAAGAALGLGGLTLRVHPRQLHGIEIDPYAHELASIVVWIGYLQWKRAHGVPFETETPILEPFTNFQLMDAIVARSATGKLSEPEWPEADFIVGNPPFLGGKKLRTAMGDDAVDAMFEVWDGRVPREADLCCYWFEKARAQIASGGTKRVGLLATQAIRRGKNREVLKAIKRSGDIFFAVDDRPWILDGAAVRVSMVAFDDESETRKRIVVYDGDRVKFDGPTEGINPDLSYQLDATSAARLPENAGLSFMGDTKVGPFDIDERTARAMLAASNPDGRSNADVVRPWVNGDDVTGRARRMWIIDFPPGTSEQQAALYDAPFEWIRARVRPMRAEARSGDRTGVRWWIHQRPRPAMRAALQPLGRFLATPRVAKYRLFVWLPTRTLPDSRLFVFARDDDYFFGVLQSRIHEVWSLRTSSRHGKGNDPTYNNTSCFEPFPLPWPPGSEPWGDPKVEAIATAAAELNRLREGHLHPVGPDGTPWPEEQCKHLTLTNLYNEPPTWLQHAHEALDRAVFAAYNWPEAPGTLDNEQILSRLLALNLQRAGAAEAAASAP
ncbi:MAG: class I SAM-dependent DNA methyltransferase [Dehalococcoidia bacterium]